MKKKIKVEIKYECDKYNSLCPLCVKEALGSSNINLEEEYKIKNISVKEIPEK